MVMAVTSSNRLFLLCWNWLWLAQTGCWNWLWLAQIGFSLSLKLVVTSSNWFFLAEMGSHWLLWMSRKDGWNWFFLVCSSTIWCWQLGWLWLVQSGPHFATLLHWLAQTGSYWLLCMTSKFIFMEKVFSLPPARNHQVHLKSFMADQAGLIMTDVKQKLIQRHVVRELPPLQRVLIQHNCECEECEGSWSWV